MTKQYFHTLSFFLFAFLFIPFIGLTAPKISCSTPIIDFKTMNESETFKGLYLIKNTGDENLKIGEIRSCCGSKNKIDKKILKPGESTKLHIELNLAGKSGKQEKNVFIASNDPKNGYLNLKFKGYVLKTYQISKRFMNWGKLSTASTKNDSFTFSFADSTKYQVLKLHSDHPTIKATLKQEKDQSYTIQLKSSNFTKEGRQRFKIILTTNHPKHKEIKVYGSLTVESDLILQPKTIAIKANNNTKLTRYLSIKSKLGSELSPSFADLEKIKGLKAQFTEKKKSQWLIKLDFDLSLFKDSKTLSLWPNKAQKAKVPLEIEILN